MAANSYYSFQQPAAVATQSGSATVVSYASPFSSSATFADVTAITAGYQARPVYSAAPASVLYVTQQPQPQQVAIALPVATAHPTPSHQANQAVQAVQGQHHVTPQSHQASQGHHHVAHQVSQSNHIVPNAVSQSNHIVPNPVPNPVSSQTPSQSSSNQQPLNTNKWGYQPNGANLNLPPSNNCLSSNRRLLLPNGHNNNHNKSNMKLSSGANIGSSVHSLSNNSHIKNSLKSSSSNNKVLTNGNSSNNINIKCANKSLNSGAGVHNHREATSNEIKFYCELCRITCASAQTFEEHQRGSKHRKRQLSKSSTSNKDEKESTASGFRCDICDISCTGEEAFKAHMKGSKHLKVIRLHQKLNKPLLQTDPSKAVESNCKDACNIGSVSEERATSISSTLPVANGEKTDHVNTDKVEPLKETECSGEGRNVLGASFVEKIQEEGRSALFLCKLCDCRFNDVNGKETHLKGKRHRINYKRKVDPSIAIERKLQSGRSQVAKTAPLRADLNQSSSNNHIDFSRLFDDDEQEQEQQRLVTFEQQYALSALETTSSWALSPLRTSADFHAMAKHSSVYPSASRLAIIERLVTNVEHALKRLSDAMMVNQYSEGVEEQLRILRGVHRVGMLAKGLLVQSDSRLRLVVMCAEKPSYKLLESVANALPKHLATLDSEYKYLVTKIPQQGGIHVVVHVADEGPITLLVSLTSSSKLLCSNEPTEVFLERDHCHEALKELRRAKWFETRAAFIPSCVIVLRLLRDFCQRNQDPWSQIPFYVLELIVAKVLSSSTSPLHPGAALRSIFEAIATGLLLDEDHLPINDPCEPSGGEDMLSCLSAQLKCQLTMNAQQTVRLITFRKLHTVLDMEPLPPRRSIRAKREATAKDKTDAKGSKRFKAHHPCI